MDESDERTPLLSETSSTHINAPPAPPPSLSSERRQGPMTAYQLMTDQKISLTIIMYALISGLYIQYDEVFSLWAKEPFHTGGLNFSTSDLGIVFSIGGIFLFIYQLFIYPPLESRLAHLGDDDETHGFGDHAGSGKVGWISWGVVVFCQVLRTCLSLQAFTSSFIMTANACPSHSRGSANGVSQAFGASALSLLGIFSSWSVENNLPAPFDFHLLFYLLGLTSAAIYVASLYVPADVDFRLDDDEEEE
ncbi:hypothetical protein BC829DRAFT_380445 [Chytridium lagenaria]|nr:hypothetical protein BC829DRAFT_380445 [Chytridium lagenaria]